MSAESMLQASIILLFSNYFISPGQAHLFLLNMTLSALKTLHILGKL